MARIDSDILRAALRDVGGGRANRAIDLGPEDMGDLVRRYMANPETRTSLLDAVVQHSANEQRSEDEPEFGPVAVEGGIYADPVHLMLEPVGSPEFDAELDLLLQFDETAIEYREEVEPEVDPQRPTHLTLRS